MVTSNSIEKIICDMYLAKSSVREISLRLKISTTTTKKCLLKHNIQIVKYNHNLKPNQIKKYISCEEATTSALALPTNIKEELIASYQAGDTALSLAQRYNVKYRSVTKLIHRGNNKRSAMPSLAQNVLMPNKDRIISLYTDGYSVAVLAPMYNVCESSVREFLKKENVKLRSISDLRKYTFTRRFFEIDSSELYYFMGFCLGDGNIGHNDIERRYNLSVCVHSKDAKILYMFCDWINIPYQAVSKLSKKEAYRLVINSIYFKYGLPKFGLCPNKTYEPLIPNIPSQYLRPFILGAS